MANKVIFKIDLQVIEQGAKQAVAAIKSISNAADRLASGSLKNFASNMSKQFDEMAQTFSDASKTMGHSANDINSILNSLVTAFGGIKNKNLKDVIKGFDSLTGGKISGNLASGFSGMSASLSAAASSGAGFAAVLKTIFATLAPILAPLLIFVGLLASLKAAFSLLKAEITVAKAVLELWKRSTQDMINHTQELQRAMSKFLDGLRQFTQGLLSVGRALTFFVSIPVSIYLQQATKQAIDFEQQLARIQKILGTVVGSAANMKSLQKFIMDVASVSLSSQEQLARFAEQLGQLGLQDIAAIKEMIVVLDLFVSATDIAAEDAAGAIGQIANAFSRSLAAQGSVLEENIAWINRLVETINTLENETGTTAGNIVETMKDVGASLGALNVPAYVVAGWAAIGQEFGMTSAEVGTALRNLSGFVVEYSDRILTATSFQGIWANQTELLTALNNNFVGTLDLLVRGLAENEAEILAVAEAQDITGRKSGRFLNTLAAAYRATTQETEGATTAQNRYNQVLEIAAQAWREGGGLLSEYEIMMNTAGGQVQMLKNNFNNLALTVGNDVLPVIADLARKMIPVLTAIADAFSDLEPNVKRNILALVGFIAVAGPLSFFTNQVAFGFILAAEGILKMLSIIPAIISWIGALVRGLLVLNPVAIIVAATLFTIFTNLESRIGQTVSVITDIFTKVIKQVGTWGTNMMDAYASGIESASDRVVRAVLNIVKAIAAFIQSFSPPREGPLSEVDMWGENLFNTYLQGFAKADFGILRDVANTVADIIRSFNFSPEDDPLIQDEARKRSLRQVIQFREQFARIIEVFRRTGRIAEEMIDELVSGFGSASDEIRNLIRLSLRYEQLQTRLRQLEQDKKDTVRLYEDEADAIMRSAMSAEEKVEALAREQQARDERIRAIAMEEEVTRTEAEILEEQLELQRELMSSLQDQSDLWQELLSLLAEIAKKTGGGGTPVEMDIGGGAINTEEFEEAASRLGELNRRLLELRVNALKVKVAFLGVLLAIKGIWDIVVGGKDPAAVFANFKKEVENLSGVLPAVKEMAQGIINSLKIDEELAKQDPVEALRQALEKQALTPQDLISFFGPFAEPEEIQALFDGLDYGALGLDSPELAASVQAALQGMLGESVSAIEESGVADLENMFGDTGFLQTLGTNASAAGVGLDELLTPITGAAAEALKQFSDGLRAGFSSSPIDPNASSDLSTLGYNIGVLADAVGKYAIPILALLGLIAKTITDFGLALIGFDPSDAQGIAGLIENIHKILYNFATSGIIDFLSNATKAITGFATAVHAAVTTAAYLATIAISPQNALSGWKTWLTEISNFETAMDGINEKVDEWAENATTSAQEWALTTQTGITSTGLAMSTMWQTAETKANEFSNTTQSILSGTNGEASNLGSAFAQAFREAEQSATDAFNTIGSGISQVQTRIDNLTGKTVVIDVVYRQSTNQYGQTVGAEQAGGIIHPIGQYKINEGGDELFTPLVPGKITSHSLSGLMARSMPADSGEIKKIEVNINGPIIRNDDDIRKLAEEVSRVLARDARISSSYVG